MALLLCNIHTRFFSSLHYKQQRLINNSNNNIPRRNIRLATNAKLRYSFSKSSLTNRLRHFLPLKSSSINGYAIENNDNYYVEHYDREQREEKVELHERIWRFIEFLPSIFPGGNWWNFSDEVEVKFLAKPVTMWRALSQMWQLVAQDRWVIFAAFSALIVAAVRAFLCEYYIMHKLVNILDDFYAKYCLEMAS